MNKEHLVVQNCNAGLSSSSQHSFVLLLCISKCITYSECCVGYIYIYIYIYIGPQWVQIWSGVVLAYQFCILIFGLVVL